MSTPAELAAEVFAIMVDEQKAWRRVADARGMMDAAVALGDTEGWPSLYVEFGEACRAYGVAQAIIGPRIEHACRRIDAEAKRLADPPMA